MFEVIYRSCSEFVLVAIEGTCNKQLLVVIDNMITQHIKFVIIMHIATKINGRILFYRNEGNLKVVFKLFSQEKNIKYNN
jgi:hypothetical protein